MTINPEPFKADLELLDDLSHVMRRWIDKQSAEVSEWYGTSIATAIAFAAMAVAPQPESVIDSFLAQCKSLALVHRKALEEDARFQSGWEPREEEEGKGGGRQWQ